MSNPLQYHRISFSPFFACVRVCVCVYTYPSVCLSLFLRFALRFASRIASANYWAPRARGNRKPRENGLFTAAYRKQTITPPRSGIGADVSPRERRFYARAMPPATSGRVSRVSMHLILFTHVFSAKSEARIPLYAHHAAAAAIFRASTQFFCAPNWRAHTVPYEILFRRRSRARPVSRSNRNKTRARKRS